MSRIPALAALCLGVILAGPAAAGAVQCRALIEGEPVTIFFDAADPAFSSFRDRLFTRGGACPAAIVITYLLPDLTAAEREVFCANVDPETGNHSLPAQGRRDAYGRCVEPSRTCRLVNTTRDAVLDLAGIGAEAAGGEGRSAIAAVTHWSGALVLSGNAGAVANLLASAGATLGTALGTPVALAGAAASVVVIGGAVWLCSDDD